MISVIILRLICKVYMAKIKPRKIEIGFWANSYGSPESGSKTLGLVEPARVLGERLQALELNLHGKPVEPRSLSVLGYLAAKSTRSEMRVYNRTHRLDLNRLIGSGAHTDEPRLFVAYGFDKVLVDEDMPDGPTEIPFTDYSVVHGIFKDASKQINPADLRLQEMPNGVPPRPNDLLARYEIVPPAHHTA